VFEISVHPAGKAEGDQILLSIALSYTWPSNITLSPFMYGLVLSGCSHSGITFASGIRTFAHRLVAAGGVQASYEV